MKMRRRSTPRHLGGEASNVLLEGLAPSMHVALPLSCHASLKQQVVLFGNHLPGVFEVTSDRHASKSAPSAMHIVVLTGDWLVVIILIVVIIK